MPSLFLYSVESHEDKLQCWIDFPEFWHWKVRIIKLGETGPSSGHRSTTYRVHNGERVVVLWDKRVVRRDSENEDFL